MSSQAALVDATAMHAGGFGQQSGMNMQGGGMQGGGMQGGGMQGGGMQGGGMGGMQVTINSLLHNGASRMSESLLIHCSFSISMPAFLQCLPTEKKFQ